MKKTVVLFFVLISLTVGLFSQEKEPFEGNWYLVDGNRLYILILGKGKCIEFERDLSEASPIFKLGTVAAKENVMDYKVKDFGILEFTSTNSKRDMHYAVSSPFVLAIYWKKWGDSTLRVYHPLVSQKIDKLVGEWLIIGEEYDYELTVDKSTITLKKGKQVAQYPYTSEQMPVINLGLGNNKVYSTNYFFLGDESVFLKLPDERLMLFQKKK